MQDDDTSLADPHVAAAAIRQTLAVAPGTAAAPLACDGADRAARLCTAGRRGNRITTDHASRLAT